MALTFATYAVPNHTAVARVVGAVAVVALTALNYRGITRTAALSRVLVAVSLVALLVVVVAIWTGGATLNRLTMAATPDPGGVAGVLQSAGLLFFAFAGYARIATLGEEVRDPARTIPRAIGGSLVITLAVYVAVAVSALAAAGPQAIASTSEPLAVAVRASGAAGLEPVVRVGAALASLGALLSLIAGVGRTGLAMARNADLPRWLASVHPRYRTPHHAELALACVVVVLVLTTDVRSVIGFSSFGVLVYYGIANASAFTQPPAERRTPQALNILGIGGCLVLVATLPVPSLLAGIGVLAAGLAGRAAVLRLRSRPGPTI
jgi:APA family basic amino acid/polyamine antiporter